MNSSKPMDPAHNGLDPHKAPPEDMKKAFKQWKGFADDDSDLSRSVRIPDCLQSGDWHRLEQRDVDITRLCHAFIGKKRVGECNPERSLHHADFYESKVLAGLIVVPNFLDSLCQKLLLDRLLKRDLSNPAHKTNLNLHYEVVYPDPAKSYLDCNPKDVLFTAKDPSMHPNLSMERVLQSKLRWITLGGQYDWTKKAYPEGPPPEFPEDIRDLLHGTFPEMEPQAAIVNFYSPGDTLSIHRDVSEQVDRGLVSISLGCDGLFIIGLPSSEEAKGKPQYQVLRLRSGDAVYMSGKARYAWHGVPKIILNTCPKYLDDWPGDSHRDWQGYMRNKRVNLNVRQIFSTDDH